MWLNTSFADCTSLVSVLFMACQVTITLLLWITFRSADSTGWATAMSSMRVCEACIVPESTVLTICRVCGRWLCPSQGSLCRRYDLWRRRVVCIECDSGSVQRVRLGRPHCRSTKHNQPEERHAPSPYSRQRRLQRFCQHECWHLLCGGQVK